MEVGLRFTDVKIPTAIVVSRQPHCLADLLVRWSSGELDCEVEVVVVVNHPDHAELCASLGVPYVHHPVTGTDDHEAAVLATLAEHAVDLVVLARYMRILASRVIAAYPTGSSTFTTRSCLRSPAPTRIAGRTTGGSR
jgi:formyltetrahydrofolate deformylase